MNEIIEIQNSALSTISELEAKIYQLELQNEFLVHEFSNVRRILHKESIKSYDGYLMNVTAMVGKMLEETEVDDTYIDKSIVTNSGRLTSA